MSLSVCAELLYCEVRPLYLAQLVSTQMTGSASMTMKRGDRSRSKIYPPDFLSFLGSMYFAMNLASACESLPGLGEEPVRSKLTPTKQSQHSHHKTENVFDHAS